MNVFGEGFPKEIIEQIKQRQKHYGSSNRSPNELAYLNSKTGWCKLVSSVDITQRTNDDGVVVDSVEALEERLKLIGITREYSGNNLAKEFVLFNGTSIQNSNGVSQRSGLATDKSIINDNVYGLGGLEFGLSPMPGIMSAEIKTLNKGSIKESTVQIKVFNRIQFQIIETLYLRLGYPVLLEWGHSSYFSNDDTFYNGSDQDWSIANEFLNGDLKDYFQILKLIQKNRLASNGNYDALLGKVKNFSWTFNTDGSFNITLSIISVGDIIESLQMNSLLPNNLVTKGIPISPNGKTDSSVNSVKNKHSIGNILEECKTLLTGDDKAISYSFPETNSNFYTGKKDIVKINWDNSEPMYYYRLGSFLKFLEKVLLIYTKKGDPIIQIDYDDANYVFHSPLQISSDPNICLIRNKLNTIELFPICEKYEFAIGNTTVGILMNVYINFTHILDIIDANINEEGKISLISLLEKICEGINYSLGNKNKISPSIDEITNRIVLIDETPIPNYNEVITYLSNISEYSDKIQGSTTEIAEFDIYGYRYVSGSTAGFIKDFSLSSTISPDLATIITIGATANAKVVGEDATAFSKWNTVLKNRITENLVDSSKVSNPNPSGQTPTIEEVYREAFKDYYKFAKDLSNYILNKDNIDVYPNTLRNLLNAQTAYLSSRQSESTGTLSTGFLPLNLSLTMEGMSGMKVYQQFKVDTSYLPSNYPKIFKFLIKTIVHKIENNIWTTQLETMSASTSTLKLESIDSPSDRTSVRRTDKTSTIRGTENNLTGKQKGSIALSENDTNLFLIDVLKGVGVPTPNEFQLQFMKIWRQHEGGKAAWNPFNTTLNLPDSTPYNYVPVRNYPNRNLGLQATIRTLRNGRYNNIINSIKEIKTQADINKAINAVNASPWGSKILPADYRAWQTFNNFIYKEPLISKA